MQPCTSLIAHAIGPSHMLCADSSADWSTGVAEDLGQEGEEGMRPAAAPPPPIPGDDAELKEWMWKSEDREQAGAG